MQRHSKRTGSKIPGIADIQSRLAYVSSVKQLEEAKQLPGCYYLRPAVTGFATLEFEKFKEIYDVGYKYGKELVSKWEEEGMLEERFGIKPKVSKRGFHERRASI